MAVQIITGDCRDVLRTLPEESVHCVVTSPPYWGLRDYGVPGIGLEETMQEHVQQIVGVFEEVRRVLRPDGTLWLNYGDAYAGSWGAQGRGDKRSEMETGGRIDRSPLSSAQIDNHPKRRQTGSLIRTGGCKAKDLMGLPWRIAFALQAAGWWLRQDIIWSKPNPMPESVTDRCTKAHEYLFLLSKSERYYFDQSAIAEPLAEASVGRLAQNVDAQAGSSRAHTGGKTNGAMKAVARAKDSEASARSVGSRPHNLSKFEAENDRTYATRNKRSVWEVATQPFKEAHFATFPPALIEPCIKAGCPKGGTVLDPFGGAGTTGLVADRLQRNAILIELNPEYAAMARRRIDGDAPLLVAAE